MDKNDKEKTVWRVMTKRGPYENGNLQGDNPDGASDLCVYGDDACCRSDSKTDGSDRASGVVLIPHGYMARLEQVHDGRLVGFGPFVGYYFRPEDPGDLSRLRFVCFNENRFYSSDMPDGAKLYEGTAVRATLPRADIAIPTQDRINPVFFEEAPEAWRDTRPEPQDEFVHFHSCYDAVGPVHTGYWIRHVAVSEFTYDMGGAGRAREPTAPLGQQRSGPGLCQDRRVRQGAGKGQLIERCACGSTRSG